MNALGLREPAGGSEEGMMSAMRGFEILEWLPLERGVLRGFCSVQLPSGLILHGCTYCVKGESRWINGPSREYMLNGAKRYQPLIEFVSRETRDRFCKAVLAALDAHLGGRP